MHLKSTPLQPQRSVHPSYTAPGCGRILQQLLRPPAGFFPALMEATVWITSATALRILGEIVLTYLPQLGALVVVVLVAPAVIAIGLSTWAPALSLLLGYRLILIAFGLLLGGKR